MGFVVGVLVAGWVVWTDDGKEPDLESSAASRDPVVSEVVPDAGRADRKGGIKTAALERTDTVNLSPKQRLLVLRARALLGDDIPDRLGNRTLTEEQIEVAAAQVEVEHRAFLEIKAAFQSAARKRADAVFAAHGYREWEARQIRVPDPDSPVGATIGRLSTPYDDQRDDEFILARRAPSTERRLLHVVRLVPESDPAYAEIFNRRLAAEAALRERLVRWINQNL